LPARFILVRRLERSWIGLNLDALRLDETAAKLLCLDVARWKITAFLIGNFLIGIAGALFGMVGGFVAPNNYTFADSLVLVSIILLGGIGNPWVSWWQLLSLWSSGKTADNSGIQVLIVCTDGHRCSAVSPRRSATAPRAPVFSGMRS